MKFISYLTHHSKYYSLTCNLYKIIEKYHVFSYKVFEINFTPVSQFTLATFQVLNSNVSLASTLLDSAGVEINRKHVLSTCHMQKIVLSVKETKRKKITMHH